MFDKRKLFLVWTLTLDVFRTQSNILDIWLSSEYISVLAIKYLPFIQNVNVLILVIYYHLFVGVVAAKDGNLTFMVGCKKADDFPVAEELLQHMAKNVVHCGTVGTGQVS